MKDERKIIDGLEHWIQNEENGVCFIPLNLCKKTIELLKEQPDIIRCKACIVPKNVICHNAKTFGAIVKDDWFCADGKHQYGR